MTTTWWMVLSQAQDRVVYVTQSCLDAYRVARRRSGGPVHLRHERLGVTVAGRHRSLTVIRVAPPRGEVRYQPTLFGSATSSASHDGATLESGFREGDDRTAIPVEDNTGPQIITLPDGGTFTWLPAGSTVAMLAESRS